MRKAKRNYLNHQSDTSHNGKRVNMVILTSTIIH